MDSLETAVIEGRLVRVVYWYDNEWGFSNRMVDRRPRWGNSAMAKCSSDVMSKSKGVTRRTVLKRHSTTAEAAQDERERGRG